MTVQLNVITTDMFGLFRKPSVNAKKPATRSKAVQQLPGNDPARIQAALADTDPQVRLTAIQDLTDLETLISIINHTAYSTPTLHDAALSRVEAIAPATKDAHLLTNLQLNEAQAHTLAQSSQSPSLRLHALTKISDQSLLALLSLEDEASAVRQKAFEKIDLEKHPDLAKQIIDRYRGKDKRLTKLAESHYQSQQTVLKQQNDLENIIVAMQQLAEGQTTDLSAFAKLEQQWVTLYDLADQTQQQHWEHAHAQAQKRLKAQSDARAARQSILDKATSLNDDLASKPYLSPHDSDRLIDDIAALQQGWQDIGSGSDPDSLRIERECNQVFEQLQKTYQQLMQNYQHSNRQRKMIDELDKTLQRAGRVDEKSIQQIQSRWKQMPKVNDAQLQIELDDFFTKKLNKLEARRLEGENAAAQEEEKLSQLQNQLNTAVESQKLKEALAARREISDLLNNCLGLTDKQRDKANQHLHQHRGTIQQLQDWAQWGGSQSREQLIADLEAASTQALSPKEIVNTLRSARKQWHQINQESGYPEKALKQAFESACDQLHEPVKEANKANSESQAKALADRELIISGLTETEETTNWKSFTDWPALNEQLREAQKKWSKAGGVSKKDWKPINDRYHAIKKTLQDRLQSPLDKEIMRREGLINKAEGLLNSDDKPAAMQTVKQLRAEWKPTLTTSRKQENTMWDRFNAACNAVFEQGQEERKAQRAEDDAALQDRQALLTELKSHQQHQHWSEILTARRDVDSLQQSWLHQAPVDTPALGKLEQQWRRELDSFQKTATAASRVKQLVMLDGLFKTACELQQAETAIAKADTDTANQHREAATRLHQQYPDYQPSLAQRQTTIEKGELTECDLAQLAEWCLEAEIIAQTPSPEADQAARRAKQVALLAEKMTQAITEEQKVDNLIAHAKAFTSSCATDAEALYERYGKALSASINSFIPDGWTLTEPLLSEQEDSHLTAPPKPVAQTEETHDLADNTTNDNEADLAQAPTTDADESDQEEASRA